jgi:hypothetical protein
MAANQALATRENQGNLAPVSTGAVFLVPQAVNRADSAVESSANRTEIGPKMLISADGAKSGSAIKLSLFF